MAKVKTSISIEEELFRELTEMAIDDDRSFSKVISRLAKIGKELVETDKRTDDLNG